MWEETTVLVNVQNSIFYMRIEGACMFDNKNVSNDGMRVRRVAYCPGRFRIYIATAEV